MVLVKLRPQSNISMVICGLFVFQGLGITVFGMAYMFVHDGLVHRRFPVGPIANVPYLQRVAAAHQVCQYSSFSTRKRSEFCQ